MVKVGSMLLSPSKYSAAILNSTKINHSINVKSLKELGTFVPSAVSKPFFWPLKAIKILFIFFNHQFKAKAKLVLSRRSI
jgi:hypothetical protein